MKKTVDTILSDEQLDAMIERYFDADTSLDEEALLKRAVAHRTEPRYDEIRAVLGLMAAKRNTGRKPRTVSLWVRAAAAAAAAVVAVVATVGINLTRHDADSSSCYAMVGDVRINDEAQVLSLMQSGLSDIHDAASETNRSIESQIADIGSFINDVE